jgi:cation:H+ antiporter
MTILASGGIETVATLALPLALVACAVLAAIATAIVWQGSNMLESSSEKLSTYYELPAIVQGAIVVAVGSSFPELSTAVISTILHGEFELGVSAIVGSALFNILVIPALAGLYGGDQLESNRDLVYKEAQFYMIAVSVLLLTFSFAVIYNPIGSSHPDFIRGASQGQMGWMLAFLPLGLYGLYVFIQYQDTMDHEADVQEHDIHPFKQWGMLVGSLLVILIGVEIMVKAALTLGDVLDTPSFLWGITVVAAGTSIPDAFVSVKAARNGEAITSIANVLGSNIFDLLVCIPAGILTGVMVANGVAEWPVINFSIAAPMMAVLTLGTIVLFGVMRTGMVLSRAESWLLLIIYTTFVLWMGIETFGLIDLIPSLPPDAAH